MILNQQLTDALDFLRGKAHAQFLSRRTRISEDELVQYLQVWQRILCVSETSENEQQISGITYKNTDKT